MYTHTHTLADLMYLYSFFVCILNPFLPPLRFRSIAKSYFRRADGVLLLYDVTCEKSFLNVREWVDMIEVMPSAKELLTDNVCI